MVQLFAFCAKGWAGTDGDFQLWELDIEVRGPTLAKNARVGHPQLWDSIRTEKGGPPAGGFFIDLALLEVDDGADRIVTVRRRILRVSY